MKGDGPKFIGLACPGENLGLIFVHVYLLLVEKNLALIVAESADGKERVGMKFRKDVCRLSGSRKGLAEGKDCAVRGANGVAVWESDIDVWYGAGRW